MALVVPSCLRKACLTGPPTSFPSRPLLPGSPKCTHSSQRSRGLRGSRTRGPKNAEGQRFVAVCPRNPHSVSTHPRKEFLGRKTQGTPMSTAPSREIPGHAHGCAFVESNTSQTNLMVGLWLAPLQLSSHSREALGWTPKWPHPASPVPIPPPLPENSTHTSRPHGKPTPPRTFSSIPPPTPRRLVVIPPSPLGIFAAGALVKGSAAGSGGPGV